MPAPDAAPPPETDTPAPPAPAAQPGRPVLRFAPSPNGRLHLGHAHSVLVNRRMADRLGGRLLLRLEDIDPGRCTPALEAAMLDDLDWLGLPFDGPPMRQSERGAAHAAALDRLRAMGLAYPAFLSRREVRERVAAAPDWPRDPDGAPHYPAGERDLDRAIAAARIAGGQAHAWRLDVAEASRRTGPVGWTEVDEAGVPVARVLADPAAWGDVVLARVDAPAAYHLAATVDDADQGVTHVVRGRDLLRATEVHALLRALLDLPLPLHHHHGLVLRGGAKLGKSRGDGTGDLSLHALRAAGVSPRGVRTMLRAGSAPHAHSLR